MQEDFWRNVMFSESIYTQTKIMIQVAQKGDYNSKFYHTVVNWSRRKNLTRGVDVDGMRKEESLIVKEEAWKNSKARFSKTQWERPTLDSFKFKNISREDNDLLIVNLVRRNSRKSFVIVVPLKVNS